MKRDLAREMYRAWRSQARRNRIGQNISEDETREKTEDPQLLGTVLDQLITSRNWRQGIAEGTLFTDWNKVVGDDVASHCSPVSLVDGELTIQTTSTAWATQLNLISAQLLKTISGSAPGALVEKLVIIGPLAPTWKKGLRTIRGGKGPRDTYN